MRVDDTDVQIMYGFLNGLHLPKNYFGFTEKKSALKCCWKQVIQQRKGMQKNYLFSLCYVISLLCTMFHCLLSAFSHFSILYTFVYKSFCMCLREVKSDW